MNRIVVRDMMTSEQLLALGPTDDLAALVDLMDRQQVRHIPVIDEEGDLLGLVTHRDIVSSVLGPLEQFPLAEQMRLLRDRKVAEVMRRGIETIDPEAEIGAAAPLMLDNKFGCLPVVEDSRLVGILTEADFVKAVLVQQQE